MAQLRGESRGSQGIEPVVHGPGGQADPGGYRTELLDGAAQG
jgi:hypothetical protein